jgi:cystathionine gamma-lyase
MASDDERSEATRVVHAGLPGAVQGEPFLPGPVLAAPYHVKGDPSGAPHGYGRYGNPTWSALERAVGELERAIGVVFASGMAASSAVLLDTLRPGDVAVLPADGYPTVRALASDHLGSRGVEVRLVPTDDAALRDAIEGAALVWLETPANPRLDCCDVAAISAAAQAHGTLVVVDNTLATPLGQRPLDLGADLSVTSATKAVTGHGDLLLGYVTTRNPDLAARMRLWRDRTGAIPGPVEAWLAHRSVATLDVRFERQCATAQALAEALAARDDVEELRYPGLPDDPAHALAAAQMRRFGPVVSFDLGTRERAERFLAALRIVAEATSFGGIHSSAERRARWGHGDAVGEGFIRFSCGIEATADVVADVEQALTVR